MKNLLKTGVSASKIVVLSLAVLAVIFSGMLGKGGLLGIKTAFGYGGGGGGGSSGGSGYTDPSCYTPVAAGSGQNLGVIGHDGHNVYDRNVKLDLDGGNAAYMTISENADFTDASMVPYSNSANFQLSSGEGSKIVYARFFNSCKIPSDVFSWNFNYSLTRPGSVLGAQTYANGTLLRGSDNRIYVVKGNTLVYIPDLAALRKYVGREILTVDDSVIVNFATINAPQGVLGVQVYANGTLLRGADHVMVYVLKNGHKVHILNLSELAAHYFGKPILNVTDDVLAQY
jgi:hypothetical protein